MPNRVAGAKCQPPRSPLEHVGKLYARASDLPGLSANIRGIVPFLQFGTPIATLMASTWFHANEGTVRKGSLVPVEPSLPRFRLWRQAAPGARRFRTSPS